MVVIARAEMETAPEPRIRRLSSERMVDPRRYTVSHGLYAQWDGATDSPDWLRGSGEIDGHYSAGYIPFSDFSDPALTRNLFYKAGSLRFDLSSLQVQAPRRQLCRYFEREAGLRFAVPLPLGPLTARGDWAAFPAWDPAIAGLPLRAV